MSDEIEVRVFRAYSGFIDENEIYLKNFAENSDVINYFTSLKSGNKNAIENAEPAFRQQVGILGKNTALPTIDLNGTSGGNYMSVDRSALDQAKDNERNGSPTPFFDAMTKDAKCTD